MRVVIQCNRPAVATRRMNRDKGYRAQLLRAEFKFNIAPVHHRLPDRIRSQATICFQALVLYGVMRMPLKAKGHSASPHTAVLGSRPIDFRRLA
ncbi:hypothetical protein [Gemmobacter lanyuensis]|uniref:hypothetical protein n=1 Tax=Gemmobacter lanyuensis TaxID=1054497 RepID=UPI00167611D9|nr:hypothetical protein [Gemmobacter lanyuensis]